MKKIIKVVDEKKGIVQITTTDERWYSFPTKNKQTGLFEYEHIPSVTWIAGFYPKGIGFYKWLANTGWDEAEAIKQAAGDKGSKVHYAVKSWLDNNEVKMDSRFLNPSTEQEEELSVEEYEVVKSFVDWWQSVKPELIISEVVVVSKKYGYAGMIDMVVKINNEVYLVDLKTSQNVWPEYELQVSAYKQAAIEEEYEWAKNCKLAVLQLGYRRNKDNFKFTEIEDKFSLFRAAIQIWKNETSEEKPKQRDLPLVLPPKVVVEPKQKHESREKN